MNSTEDVIEHSDGHRGAFGEFGASGQGFIDRGFRERIVIVGVSLPPHDEEETNAHLDELALLVDTAGADVVARVVQRRDRIHPATFIGSGKVEEVRNLCEALDCDTVVFDEELSPTQQFALERLLGRTAIDRTAVILDIFAQNAASIEGKAQVELAQTKYRLPRIRGKGRSLSQQGGGIGTRGPGETQLEVDRRRLVRRVHHLEAQLREIDKARNTQRKARSRSNLPTVAIVGYTNAGKSTLLNALTSASVLSEDRLFATLDSATRKLKLPGGQIVLLSDTVGFIRKLPHELVEAFRSTLAAVAEADLLVHVADASHPELSSHIGAVREVLSSIDADSIPEILVLNKSDRIDQLSVLAHRFPTAVCLSAQQGLGIESLLARIGEHMAGNLVLTEALVPFDRGDLLAACHRLGVVDHEEPTDGGMQVVARVPGWLHDRLIQTSS